MRYRNRRVEEILRRRQLQRRAVMALAQLIDDFKYAREADKPQLKSTFAGYIQEGQAQQDS